MKKLCMLVAGLSVGCGPTGVRKLVSPSRFLSLEVPDAELADVRVTSGLRDDPEREFQPEMLQVDGRETYVPVSFTERGVISISPLGQGVEASVWVRRVGGATTGFLPILSVTGSLQGDPANELRWLPKVLDEPFELRATQLQNVFNGYEVAHDDLLMIRLQRDDTVDHYLFHMLSAGWRTKLSYAAIGELRRTREGPMFGPVVGLNLAVGYRPRTSRPLARWMGNNVALAIGLGIGEREAPEDDPTAEPPVSSLVRFAGGIELFDLFSIQYTLSAAPIVEGVFGRRGSRQRPAVAFGVDLGELQRRLHNVDRRVFGRNPL